MKKSVHHLGTGVEHSRMVTCFQVFNWSIDIEAYETMTLSRELDWAANFNPF